MRVAVIDGKSHEVDSSRRDFEIAASMALRQACQRVMRHDQLR